MGTYDGMYDSVMDLMLHENFMMEIERSEDAFMLSRPNQSHIIRTIIESVTPDITVTNTVTCIDGGSSLQLAVAALLHNIRSKVVGKVRGFAGGLKLSQVGDLIIPHHIAGSIILETAVVDVANLPSGCRLSLGRPGKNALQISGDALGNLPPSLLRAPIYNRIAPPSGLLWDQFLVTDKHGGTHKVVWDGVVDTRAGERAFVLFQDGSASCVLSKYLLHAPGKSQVDLSKAVPPTCILSGCDKPVEQGLCPIFCGRKSSCSYAHYKKARDGEGFIHPGFIRPGVTLKATPALKRRAANSSVPMPPTEVALTSHEAPIPLVPAALQSLTEKYTRIKNAASAPQLPTAWLKHAASLQNDLDFVSLFDGKSGLINKTAETFGLVGLPPVDVANTTARLDL